MAILITVETIQTLLHRHGVDNFLKDLIKNLRRDFARWDEFNKVPRSAAHVKGGRH